MMKKIILSVLVCVWLFGNSKQEEVIALSKYLVAEKGYATNEAVSTALATVYGRLELKSLLYDENSEMFFARITTSKGEFSQEVRFYMPKSRAYDFLQHKRDAKIFLYHSYKDNDIEFKRVDIDYKGIVYPAEVVSEASISLKIGGYFVGRQNTDLLASKKGVGATINLQDLLGMEQKTSTFRMDFLYRFNAKHRIYFSYYSIKNSNAKKVQKSFDYSGETIQAGADVNAYFDTTIYKLVYEYSAYTTNKLDLLFRAGIHTTGVKFGIKSHLQIDNHTESNVNESVNVTAPLPIFGLGIAYDFSKSFSIGYNVDYFYLSFDDVSGSMSDTVLSFDYKYNKYFGAGIGLNATKMRVEAKDGAISLELNHDVAGIIGYVIFGY